MKMFTMSKLVLGIILEIGFPSFFFSNIYNIVDNNFQSTGIKPKSWNVQN
jgi:hypothetical protein